MNASSSSSQMRHILSILKAAKPYMAENVSQSINILLKAEELVSSFPVQKRRTSPLQAMELSGSDQTDEKHARPLSEHRIEKMLTEVKKVCSPGEQASINTILNLVKARKLYQSYQFYQKEQPENHNPDIMDFLAKQLEPEQLKTFEMLKSVLNT